ncbi:MAG: type I restriction endonuclease subunit R [Spirulina sp. SIO3F2]|nr:type I restriction endonuclease subunit R [Spirulina sp. SIO3F2]
MPKTIGIIRAITNLRDVHLTFNLAPSDDEDFFPEWFQDPLPELTDAERLRCDQLRERYQYYQTAGAITESTVNLILVAPLLELLGVFQPPYLVRGEKYIKVAIEDRDQILEGLIDVLVMQEQLWLVVLESKRYGFSVMQALPQTLSYMMGNPSDGAPAYGLITTGEDYLFVKLDAQGGRYDLSDKLTLSKRRENELYQVVQVLKRLIKLGNG